MSGKLCWLLPLICGAAQAVMAQDVPRLDFTQYTTANGLRVALAPDKGSPTVTVAITYDFGSRNERPGQTGVANLLHAMRLRELQRGCKDRLLIPEAGKDEACRGSNNQERTSYSLSVPAERWERALSLLAGQMRALDIDTASLNSERSSLLEQRRAGDGASTRAAGKLLELGFTSFAYKHGVEGSAADLEALTVADVQRVFQTYFAPDNAALALAGNFDLAKVRRAIEKHFGSLPRRGSGRGAACGPRGCPGEKCPVPGGLQNRAERSSRLVRSQPVCRHPGARRDIAAASGAGRNPFGDRHG